MKVKDLNQKETSELGLGHELGENTYIRILIVHQGKIGVFEWNSFLKKELSQPC